MATQVRTKRIDADTHFFVTVDYALLRDALSGVQQAQLREMMAHDALRVVDPDGLRAALTGAPLRDKNGDPEWDIQARLAEMDRLGFDTQVLNVQRAMPTPLKTQGDEPLWLRRALAPLYNDASARIQTEHPGRFIGQITVPWDDIEASVRELERAAGLGLKAVAICGSWMDRNLDAYELYPFWEAVEALGLACMVHNHTQGHRGTMYDHQTEYPMVGTERYHRLHIGTYLGFGIDYTVACAALTLGGVLDRFPGLRFAFFEAGATWWAYAMAGADRSFYIERACSRTNTPPSELMRRHTLTTVENVEPLEQLVAAYGADNFVIGTDFPHPEFQRLPNGHADITQAAISPEDQAKILGGNIARFLEL
jgi:predicted TIM-barrel fold metal-dependent hydrolase